MTRIQRRCRVGQCGARLRPGKASRRVDGKRQRLDIPLHGQRGGTISRSLLLRRPGWPAQLSLSYDRGGCSVVNGTVGASKRRLRSRHQRWRKVSSWRGETPSSASAFIKSSIDVALGSRAPDSHKEMAASEHPRTFERTACFDQVRVRSAFSCSANAGVRSGGSPGSALGA